MHITQVAFISQKSCQSKTVKQNSFGNSTFIDKNKCLSLDKIPLQSLKANYLSFKGETDQRKNVALAKEALNYVKSMNLYSTTKVEYENPSIAYSGDEDYKYACQKRMRLDFERKNKSIDEFISITARKAPLFEVGNCAEQAILVAHYLNTEKDMKNFAIIAAIKPNNMEMFKENPIKHGYNLLNHVFVVVGLDENADLEDPLTWGKDAAISDPWGDIAGPVDKNIDKVKNLLGRNDDVVFMNYSPFIDPSRGRDESTEYNWENYRRAIKGDYIQINEMPFFNAFQDNYYQC